MMRLIADSFVKIKYYSYYDILIYRGTSGEEMVNEQQ